MWPTHTPLKPKNFNPVKATPPFYMELKDDGYRFTISVYKGVLQVMMSGTRINHVNKVKRHLPAWVYQLPEQSVVECEFFLPEKPASLVPSAIKGTIPDILSINAFAIPFYHGTDVRDLDYHLMNSLIATVTGKAPEFQVVPTMPDLSALEAMAKLRRVEGFVLKERGYANWWKVKIEHTADLKVSGLQGGRGKYFGKVGAVILQDGTGREVGTAGGFDDATRFAITEKDIGRICEIKYQYITEHGKLRHGRFKRWREDKDVAEVIAYG